MSVEFEGFTSGPCERGLDECDPGVQTRAGVFHSINTEEPAPARHAVLADIYIPSIFMLLLSSG